MTDTKTCTKCGETRSVTDGIWSLAGKRISSTCKPCKAAMSKEWYSRNKQRKISYQSEKDCQNKDAANKRKRDWARQKYHQDDVFQFKAKVRAAVYKYAVRIEGIGKELSTEEMLGCSIPSLKSHIESNFLPGMTWENRSEWHIDHRVPLATAKTVEDVIRLNHYTNLRPLWAIDNLRKGAKLDYHL